MKLLLLLLMAALYLAGASESGVENATLNMPAWGASGECCRCGDNITASLRGIEQRLESVLKELERVRVSTERCAAAIGGNLTDLAVQIDDLRRKVAELNASVSQLLGRLDKPMEASSWLSVRDILLYMLLGVVALFNVLIFLKVRRSPVGEIC